VEVALKMAFQYWQNIGEKQRCRFLSFEGAYHGDTLGAMSVSAPSVFNQVFYPLLFSSDRVPFPFTFDGDEDVAAKEMRSIEAIEKLIKRNKDEYAAIIVEPLVQGAGGMRMCRPQFLQDLEKLVKSENILLIYDEVFVGFGRTGDWFACTKSKTLPDMICLSKGITGGFLPMSVTIATQQIYDAFYQDDPLKTFFHGHSYTANPLGCAAANASLKLLEEQSFRKLEQWHRKYSYDLQNSTYIEQLRFCGTIAAFNIKTSRHSGYLNTMGNVLRQACLDKGVYIRPLGDVIYLLPPYCMEEEDLAYVYKIIKEVLYDVFSGCYKE
jgi:adenosylmethionine-8-amino-7-oxononanoate aminotransferase